MKIWIKYLAGILIGLAFALISPLNNPGFNEAVNFLTDLAVQIGRYALYPVLFFSFTLAVFEMRESRSLLRLGIISTGVISITTFSLTVIGLIAVLIRNPSRIPIMVEGSAESSSLGIGESLLQLFPSSAFSVFSNGLFILPLCIFAGFLGAGCAVDKLAAKATLNLFDSLSRVVYAVLSFFVDIIAIGMIAIAVWWGMEMRTMLNMKVFGDFIMLLSVLFLIIALGVYPLALRLIAPKVNPYRVLYGSIASILAAFFSTDANMTLPIMLRHVNESLGVKRRISSITLPVFSLFARAGTAMVVTVSFIIILKSYSSMGISFQDMVWLMGVSMLFSVLLGRFPAGGAYLALAAVCTLYGRGFESGYLILKPAAFFICAIATALDTLTAIMGTYLIAHRQEMTSHRDLRFFI